MKDRRIGLRATEIRSGVTGSEDEAIVVSYILGPKASSMPQRRLETGTGSVKPVSICRAEILRVRPQLIATSRSDGDRVMG